MDGWCVLRLAALPTTKDNIGIALYDKKYPTLLHNYYIAYFEKRVDTIQVLVKCMINRPIYLITNYKLSNRL